MNILSLKQSGHDTSAAILTDDGRLFAAEEERFNRIKHSWNLFPKNAIHYCLSETGLRMQDIDYIGIATSPKAMTGRDMIIHIKNSLPNLWKPYYAAGFIYRTRRILKVVEITEKLIRNHFGYCPPIKFIEHHLAHAASSYRMSGFRKANIITVDGEAEIVTAMLAVGKDNDIEIVKKIYLPHSLGHMYSNITGHLGFKPGDGEGKVMGLAAYGKPSIDFSNILTINNGEFKINYKNIVKLPYRRTDEPLTQLHKNIAASLQKALTAAMIELVKYMYELTGYKNLCLAGGVALNADANGKILQTEYVNHIFIQPAAGDAGTVVGACLEIAQKNIPMEHNYLGPQWSSEMIEKTLKQFKLKYIKVNDTARYVGEDLLANGKIVGWFQERMELGPRALGNRSILADPREIDMKNLLNNNVKHREAWRPFAPSLLEEHASKYLVNSCQSPYMILMFDIIPERQEEIVASIHVDGTARAQTVSKKTNKQYYDLISAFKRQTGVPVLVNTSFNLAGDPMVCSPADAIKTFYASGMDYLVLGDCILKK